jgi:hypothetical protein
MSLDGFPPDTHGQRASGRDLARSLDRLATDSLELALRAEGRRLTP